MRGVEDGLFVAVLAPERQHAEIGQRGEEFYGALCKQFGGRAGKGDGQFDDGVRARKDGVFCPRVFFQNGHFSALGKFPAHHAHDGVAAAAFFCLVQQVNVSVVQGIVFANNAANFHFFP